MPNQMLRLPLLFLCAWVLTASPVFADAPSGEVKASTPEIQNATPPQPKDDKEEPKKNDEDKVQVKIEVDVNAKEETAAKNGDEIENHIDRLEINNERGIQAIFINSKVTIHGGSIHAELKNIEGVAEERKPDEAPPSEPSRPRPPTPRPDEQPSKFEELVKDATKAEGLFTTYFKEDRKLYWEIKPDQLDKNFLLTTTISSGVGSLRPGDLVGGYDDTRILYFRKFDEKIELMQRNFRFTADDEPRQRALAGQYLDSLVASIPIEATNTENKAFLVEMSNFYLMDYFQIQNQVRYGLDRQNSYILETKTLPQNVLVKTLYNFRGQGATLAVPDSRSIAIEMVYNIQPLRDNPDFVPREPDYRIGYFLEAKMDFSDPSERTLFKRYINRFDIRKASPELELSPPVEPVVFWLHNATPHEYRDAIRDGILFWNKAFEKIGVKDALVVKEQPDDADWDAADTRYNVAYWNESFDRGYAYAQWFSDPRTGEVLRGAFVMEGIFARGPLFQLPLNEPPDAGVEQLRKRFESRRDFAEAMRQQQMAHESEPPSTLHGFDFSQRHRCTYGYELAQQAAMVMTMIAADHGIDSVTTEEAAERLVYQYLKSVSAHEMGHVLGLRHNFKGTTLISVDDLLNPEVDVRSNSVMAYEPILYNPDKLEDWTYISHEPGPYDYLAIQYGYQEVKPATGETESDALRRIADKQELPENVFATDEDVIIGLDPQATVFTLTDDPLGYSRVMAQRYLDTVPKLPNLVKEGDSYSIVRQGFIRMLNSYLNTSYDAITYLGGMHVNRVMKGVEYSDRMPLDPVSPAKQREALEYILSEMLSDNFFQADPELLNMLAVENWYHWGASGIAFTGVPLTTTAASFYEVVIYDIFSSTIMNRIQQANLHRHPQAVHFSLPELFNTAKDSIWSEVYAIDEETISQRYTNKDPLISVFRRMVQRTHLKRMIALALEPPFGVPDDARTLAWRTITDLDTLLSGVLDKASGADIDDYSRAHLEESHIKIKRALESRLSVRVDFW